MDTEVLDPPAEELLALSRVGPGVQAVLQAIAATPSLASDRDATIAAAIGVRITEVATVLDRLRSWGWLRTKPDGEAGVVVDHRAMRDLALRYRGLTEGIVLAGRSIPEVVPIATLPETSKALRATLGEDPGPWFETRDGFSHVVARARTRIVFLVPFMDAVGADAVISMLGNCRAERRIVICRPDSQAKRYYVRFAPRLAEVGAEVREYWIPRLEGSPPAETFHAKLVMADHDLVYVGSSNLLSSSLDGGLECGVLLEGVHARPFRKIVDAVLTLSVPVSVPIVLHPSATP